MIGQVSTVEGFVRGVDGQLEVDTSVAEDELPWTPSAAAGKRPSPWQPSEASRGGLSSEIMTPT